MRATVGKVRPGQSKEFDRILEGLWLSGLRSSEACTLSWDWNAKFSVLLEGRYPMYKILAESEKGHSDRLLPIAPEFAEWLSRVPEGNRRGEGLSDQPGSINHREGDHEDWSSRERSS